MAKAEIEYKYCMECGGEFSVGGKNLLVCSKCHFQFFINARPCVGAVLVSEGKYGFCVRGIEPHIGTLDVVGGFLDYTENFEEAMEREAKEELGIQIEIEKLKYIGSCNSEYEFGGYILHPVYPIYLLPIIDKTQIKVNDDVVGVEFFEYEKIPFDNIAFPELREFLRKKLKN